MDTSANRRLLLDALRSGEYEYGRGELRSIGTVSSGDIGECFCVFGVACDVFSKHTSTGKWVELLEDEFTFECETDDYGLEDNSCYPPVAVIDFFGITLDQQRHLMSYNDNNCASFFQMANKIEEMFNERE